MVSKVLDTATEEGTGEWSKQAQALVNRLTCNRKGEKDVADYGTMNYPPGNKEVASGPKAVGELASKYFHKVSALDIDCTEFDLAFARRIGGAVQDIKDQHMQEEATAQHLTCPSRDEIREALKDAGKKLHKAPGDDGVCNWMLVWGRETVVEGLHKLYKAVWDTKHLPASWRQGSIKFLARRSLTTGQSASSA